jgi:hypothetical protein
MWLSGRRNTATVLTHLATQTPLPTPDDVPDGAPEIDVELASPADLASALLSTTHLPASAEVFLQTARPGG